VADDDWRGASGKNCHIFRKRTASVPLSCNMNRSILHIASYVIWTTILCRYCEIINHVSYCGIKHYAGEFYTWIGVLDTRVHSSYQQAEISRSFVGKFLTGPYYTMRRVIWTVTVRSLITFLFYILCPLGATQVSFKRGLRCSTGGCIVPASKLKFHDYL